MTDEARKEAEAAAECAREYIEAHTEYETLQRRTSTGVEQYRLPADRPKPTRTAGYVSEAYRCDYRVESKTFTFSTPGFAAASASREYAVVEVNDHYHVRVEWGKATVVEPRTSAADSR